MTEDLGTKNSDFFLAEFPSEIKPRFVTLFHVFFSSPPCLALKTHKDEEEDEDDFSKSDKTH